jgi:hypothetical protein
MGVKLRESFELNKQVLANAIGSAQHSFFTA